MTIRLTRDRRCGVLLDSIFTHQGVQSNSAANCSGTYTHRLLSSSFLVLPYRFLNINHEKELLRSLWVLFASASLPGLCCKLPEAHRAGHFGRSEKASLWGSDPGHRLSVLKACSKVPIGSLVVPFWDYLIGF